MLTRSVTGECRAEDSDETLEKERLDLEPDKELEDHVPCERRVENHPTTPERPKGQGAWRRAGIESEVCARAQSDSQAPMLVVAATLTWG